MKQTKNNINPMRKKFLNSYNNFLFSYFYLLHSLFTVINRNKTPMAAFSLIVALFVSCGPSTVITASWKSPVPAQKYNRILVAALTSNTIAKVTLENEVATALSNNAEILKSISEFPPDIHNTNSDKEAIMKNVKDKNVDAILTISLINKETETRYIPGAYPYNPLIGYNYYDSFWGYYSYRYPLFYDPGYYVQDKIYFIETNLYDVGTEKLVWSAQSRTYNPVDLQTFSKEFSSIIVEKMKTDGVLNGVKNIPIAR